MISLDKVDISGLERKILEKSIAMKKSLGEAMREEMGLLCPTLIKYTQPFGTGAKARQLGESAILRDMTEVFYVLPDSLCAGRTIIYGGQYAGFVQIFAKKSGVVYITPGSNWRIAEDIGSLHAHLNELRDNNGRVRRNRNKVEAVARIAIINIWVVTKTQFDALLKLVADEVGFAKGGWATCAKKIGRTNAEIPEWIKKHDSPGSVIDKTKDAEPSITIINEVNYTGRVLSESAKRLAIKERETKIQLAIDRAIKYGVKDK